MKIKELIEKLQALPDPEVEVQVAVLTHSQVYPQAYATPNEVTKADGGRIYIHLPKGFYISERRAAGLRKGDVPKVFV